VLSGASRGRQMCSCTRMTEGTAWKEAPELHFVDELARHSSFRQHDYHFGRLRLLPKLNQARDLESQESCEKRSFACGRHAMQEMSPCCRSEPGEANCSSGTQSRRLRSDHGRTTKGATCMALLCTGTSQCSLNALENLIDQTSK
jgi:hypothetical protein